MNSLKSISAQLIAPRTAWAKVYIFVLTALAPAAEAASVDRYWDLSPYRVRVSVHFQTSEIVRVRLEPELPRLLERRVDVAFGALWKLTNDPPRVAQAGVRDVANLVSEQDLAEARRQIDKWIVLLIRENPLGFSIAVQEYDCLLETWGPTITSSAADLGSLPELCFANLQEAFSPMAKFRVIRESPDKVELIFRGSALPRPLQTEERGYRGKILRPVLRRTDREGQPVEGGIQPVAWTYLSVDAVEEGKSGNEPVTATIHSHTARPFGVRQRGRVEQLASVVRIGEIETRLRLHSRDEAEIPLSGFLVYQRNAGEKEEVPVGKTDRNGTIVIPPGNAPIQVAFVQSSGQWIAKIPLVPGADGLIEAPLLDDRKRLEAEAKLTAIREELIDIVARRNIIAARTRIKIKQGDLNEANALVKKLEQLPTASEFEQRRIRQQERLVKSKDPRVQGRIEKLFNDTRAVLAEFLAPGLVQELKREIAAANQTAQH